MESLVFLHAQISHNRAKKGNTMLIFLCLAALAATAGLALAAQRALARLPRSNGDWIFY